MGHSDIGVTFNVYTHLGLEDATAEMARMGTSKREGEDFGRVRTAGVIVEDIQDGMKRRAEPITTSGGGLHFFMIILSRRQIKWCIK